jgi:branched-chain amino acid transport system permease protein
MTSLRSPILLVTLLVIGLAGLVPLLTDSASLRETFFSILIVITLASSINILMGYTGYVSFGHIVFFGLGGYVAFYLMQNASAHFVIAAPAAGLVAGLFALLLGIPILRLRGAYFALATIGVNEAMRAFITNFEPFGAAVGMFFNFSVYDSYGGAKSAAGLAYVAMIVIALSTVTASFLVKKSKFGLGLMAIREDQDTAQVLGIDPPRYKVLAYTISAVFPALAGATFFFKNGIIEPGPAFDLQRSIESLVMVMLGGYGTVIGPIVGAVVYDRLRSFLITSDTFSSLHLFIAGVLLLIIVLFVTAGLVGWLRQRFPLVRRMTE